MLTSALWSTGLQVEVWGAREGFSMVRRKFRAWGEDVLVLGKEYGNVFCRDYLGIIFLRKSAKHHVPGGGTLLRAS